MAEVYKGEGTTEQRKLILSETFSLRRRELQKTLAEQGEAALGSLQAVNVNNLAIWNKLQELMYAEEINGN